jgi:hypothetical protein
MTNYTARYRLVIELEVDMQFSCDSTPDAAQKIALDYLPQLTPDKFDWKTKGLPVGVTPTLYGLDKD